MQARHIALTASIFTLCFAGACLADAGAAADGQPGAAVAGVRQSFDLQVPYAPAPVLVGSERRLAYELHLTNFARDPLTLTGIEMVDESNGRVIGRLSGAALDAALHRPGLTGESVGKGAIEPGRRGVVYVDLEMSSAPTTLRHRIEFGVPGSLGPERATMTGGRTAIDVRPLATLSPPLRGGPWVAVYEPGMERGHRRVIYAVGGKATIPGRHAIDWMRPATSADGASRQDPSRGAGAEVLAVADGVIASTRDGVPEPKSGATRPRVSLADATGNYVSIDIGHGRYAFYEHLMPGLLVKPGDRVRRGQVIGRLGSTGQASRPHLHFHLADANSPLAAEGLPYLLAGGRMIGAYKSIAAFEEGLGWTSAPSLKAATLPPPNAVMMFEDAPGGRP